MPDTLADGWRSLGPVTGYRDDGCGLQIECGAARLQIIPERCGIIRVRFAPEGDFGRDHSWSVQPPAEAVEACRIEEDDEAIELVTSSLRVRIQRDPCRIAFLSLDGKVLCADEPARGISSDSRACACWKRLGPDDHFFGLGEKGLPFDKRGTAVVNWTTDNADHEPWSDPLYQSHPFVMVFNRGASWGIYFDNTFRSWFDMGKTARDAWGFGADGGELNYYFIPGPAPADVLRRYAALVGATPLPPLWALGYQQCRWSYESARRLRDIAQKFRRRKIPCDVLYIDIDYMDAYRCFTWNPKTFPAPEKLLRDLRKSGIRVVSILDPGIKRDPAYRIYAEGMAAGHFCRDESGEVYVGKVWPGESVYPDFTRSATRQWWGDLYKCLLDAGLAGFWNDMNEPVDFSQPDGLTPLGLRHDNDGRPSDHRGVHNVYGMQMTRATFDGLLRHRPAERPFLLTRAGFAGVQRYAAVWTGDNKSTWEHLRMSVPMLLNMGLSGIAFCGADVGGFFGVPTPELLTRWLQLGIFYPFFRTHTCGGPEQDPWCHGRAHEKLNRTAIEIRYRLLPYIYTEMRAASLDGTPLMRPLLLDFPAHANATKIGHEFMFGPQMLVAPVLEAGAKTRLVRLPLGDWWQFDLSGRAPARHIAGALEDELICGVRTGRINAVEQKIPVSLDTIPAFARAGAVIPMRDVIQHVEERPLDEVILRVFPGDGGGRLYCDDGLTFDYRQGRHFEEHYASSDDGRVRAWTITGRAGDDDFAPAVYHVRFEGISKAPTKVQVGDQLIPAARGRSSRRRPGRVGTTTWQYDRRAAALTVTMARPAPNVSVSVHLGTGASVREAAKRTSRKKR